MSAPSPQRAKGGAGGNLLAQLAQFEKTKQQQQQQQQKQQQQPQSKVGAQSKVPVKQQKQSVKWSKYIVPQNTADTATTTTDAVINGSDKPTTIGGHLNLMGFTSSDCNPEFWAQCEDHVPTLCHFPKVSNGVVPVCKECSIKMSEREDSAAPIGPKQGTCAASSDCIYCCLGQDPTQVHIMGYAKHMNDYCGDDEYCNGDDYYSPIGGNARHAAAGDTKVHPVERKPLILTGLRDRPPFILIVNNPEEQNKEADTTAATTPQNDTIGYRGRYYGGGAAAFGTGVALGALGATSLGVRTPYYYYPPPQAPYYSPYYDGGYPPQPYYYRRWRRPYSYIGGKEQQQQQQTPTSFSASFAIQPTRSNGKSAQETLDLVGIKEPKHYAKAAYNKVKEVFVSKPTRLGGKKWLKKKVSSLGYYVDPRRVASWKGGPGNSSSHWWYTGNNLHAYRPTGRKWPVIVLGLPEAQGPNVVIYSNDMALSRCVAVDVTTGIPCPNAVDPEDICPGCGQQHYCSREHAHYVAAVQLATKYKRGYDPSSFLYYCPIKREFWEGAL